MPPPRASHVAVVRRGMARRTPRWGAILRRRRPVWPEPSKRAELYLLKLPADGESNAIAGRKRVNSPAKLLNYIIVMLRRPWPGGGTLNHLRARREAGGRER